MPKLGYIRKSREPKRRFILFCEGENTEPQYFSALKQRHENALIDVEIVRGVGVPMTIAKKAIEYGKSVNSKQKKDSFEENDQIWAIFDRDEHPKYSDAVSDCEQNGINVGRSNPCFEVWLILHEQEFDAYIDRHQVQKILGELRPEYCKHGAKSPNCEEMVTRVDVAEKRSKKQLARRKMEGNPYGNPSTTVGLLTREIRKAAKLSSP